MPKGKYTATVKVGAKKWATVIPKGAREPSALSQETRFCLWRT